MNFIKSLISTVVTIVAGPFIRLFDGKPKSKLETTFNVIGAAARVTYGASFFVAVPAVALFLAKAWLMVVLGLVAFSALLTIFTMLLGAAAIGAVAASINGTEIETEAAAA